MSDANVGLKVRQIELMSDAGRIDAARVALARLHATHPELTSKGATDADMQDRISTTKKSLASMQPTAKTSRSPLTATK